MIERTCAFSLVQNRMLKSKHVCFSISGQVLFILLFRNRHQYFNSSDVRKQFDNLLQLSKCVCFET
jgi:hypothetical protein